jgi:glutamate-ammonia-ligase adenylyltransferase
MPDLEPLERELIGRYPESWVRHHLRSFPASYRSAFPAEEIGRHVGLMLALSDEQPVIIEAREAGAGDWWLVVVGYDAFQFLSTLCCLLAVRGLSIEEGRVFTSKPPPAEAPPRAARGVRGAPRGQPPRRGGAKGPDRRPKIVDVFRVRRVDGQPAPPDWEGFQDELNGLTRLLREGAYEDVHHRLIGRFVAALDHARSGATEGLEPIDLRIDPAGSETATVVAITARDSLGFLYLTASALALCGIRIVQADIRTGGGRVDDTLWVTDRWGHKITAETRIRELRLSLILIEHFSSRLPLATNPEAALVHFSKFATETMARPDWAEGFAALDRSEVLDDLARVLGESEFLWEDYLHAQPEILLPMVGNPAEWHQRRTREELARELATALDLASTFDERRAVIRKIRDREIFRADVRSILGRSGGPAAFSAELSDVAEAVLEAAYQVAVQEQAARAPVRVDGRPIPAVLFGLGKLGGRELGFASDLELMLVYDDREITVPPGRMGALESFDRIVTLLRQLLTTRQGGTFELDFRLRPHGKGGPPATSWTAFRNYYRPGGPAWGYERQALIKLRAVAGDRAFAAEVEAWRDAYVYGPEPFDLEGYRRVRRLQLEQRVRPGTINAKYSPGALVDIEYFVQALQIARGGCDPSLRSPNTLQAIAALERSGHLTADQAHWLRDGYLFFRALVDALRIVHGHAKDLAVPRAGSEEFAMLVRRMRLRGPDHLRDELSRRMDAVQGLVARLPEFLGIVPSSM